MGLYLRCHRLQAGAIAESYRGTGLKAKVHGFGWGLAGR